MIAFHVIYTPGTTRAVLPLAFSLLRTPGARFVLVDNGCPAGESKQIRAVADSEERFSYLRLSAGRETLDHGAALNRLIGISAEPWFAILDSDIVASGDFLAELKSPPAGVTVRATGWPVWVEDEEAVCDDRRSFLGGPFRQLPDGPEVGGTFCTIYRFEALHAALASAPDGMEAQDAVTLPSDLLQILDHRGWRFERFGTGRLVHLLLLLAGESISNRDSGHLHHIGGVSHSRDVARSSSAAALRRRLSLLLRGRHSPIVNLSSNLAHRFSRPGRARARLYRRKARVTAYLSRLMADLREGRPPAPAPPTGADDVDTRLDALVRTLIDDYPAYCDRLRRIIGTQNDESS